MTLEGIEKNLNKIRELGEQHNKLLKERKEIENKLEGLKGGYEEGKYGRDVFSEYNKKLTGIKENITKIREKVKIFSGNIRKEVDDEIKNAK